MKNVTVLLDKIGFKLKFGNFVNFLYLHILKYEQVTVYQKEIVFFKFQNLNEISKNLTVYSLALLCFNK